MKRKATPLKRRTLRNEVLDFLLDCIVKQRYTPGDKIVESRIAEELQISQGAVREAFRDCVAMGFLETKPYSSTKLRVFNIKELIDYYECRREIEIVAVKWGIEKQHCEKFDFQLLQHCIDRLYLIHSDEDPVGRSKVGLAFHETIVQGSGSPALEKAWKALGHYYWSFMGLYWNTQHSIKPLQEKDLHNAQDHKLIYDSLLKGDLNKTCTLMREHFDQAIRFLLNSE